MTNTQIKDYLKKYRIDSEESLAKHIEELKRNTKPNNDIIFPLVYLLLNEKSVLLSFFRENSKERGETAYVRTVTPFFLDEMLGKCSTQCFCDGSCKKPQEKKLGGYIKPNVYVNSTRHKAREEGNFHKEIVGDLEGVNKPKGVEVSLKELKENTINNVELGLDIADILGITLCDNRDYIYKLIEKKISAKKDKIKTAKLHTYPLTPEECFKDDIITSSNRGERETIEGLKYNNLKPSLDVVINRQFPKALQLVALATEYGHKKYIENDVNYLNYKSVKGGSQTYFDASARHSTDRNGLDESGLPHIIHAVWSSLAGLELWAEENKINIKEFTENYMKNLQD